MGFTIETTTGVGKVIIRGTEDGVVEFCEWVNKKNKDTQEIERVLNAYQYYSSIEQAFNQIAKLRICNSKATTLAELVFAIKEVREDIRKELGVL